MRTRTKSGFSGSSTISSILPTGTPEKLTALPLARPSTDCLKKTSYWRADPSEKPASQPMNSKVTSVSASTTPPTKI
jgi:hypothetical protein